MASAGPHCGTFRSSWLLCDIHPNVKFLKNSRRLRLVQLAICSVKTEESLLLPQRCHAAYTGLLVSILSSLSLPCLQFAEHELLYPRPCRKLVVPVSSLCYTMDIPISCIVGNTGCQGRNIPETRHRLNSCYRFRIFSSEI